MHIPLRAATSYYRMCLRIQYSINNGVSAIYNQIICLLGGVCMSLPSHKAINLSI